MFNTTYCYSSGNKSTKILKSSYFRQLFYLNLLKKIKYQISSLLILHTYSRVLIFVIQRIIAIELLFLNCFICFKLLSLSCIYNNYGQVFEK